MIYSVVKHCEPTDMVLNKSLLLLIPLTNRVQGPYHKLWTKFFPPRFKYGPSAKRVGHKLKGKNEDP